jgi:hypothetical protein
MRALSRVLLLAAAITIAVASSAYAQAPAGLGDQLFATGGDVTVQVLCPCSAGLVSELRLYNDDGTFTAIASNRDFGKIVTLPARPAGQELVFGIFVQGPNTTFKMGPGDRNPDGLAHARVTKTGERQFDVGFEDLLNGGDRDYDDNVFRFTGGLAPNRMPVADDQALTTPQGTALPITLTATDPDGDPLTFSLLDAPLHGTVAGSGSSVTYTPAPGFNGLDTFGFTASDGESAAVEGRITIKVTPVNGPGGGGGPGGPGGTTGSGGPEQPDCPAGELTLVNVVRVGKRVRVTGLAERTLAGVPVNITEGGLVVARATIRPDGGFKVGVALPAKRGGRTLRYQARLGALRSRNLRLRRRMITTSARLRGGRIVFSGRVVKTVRLPKRTIVRLYARPRGCGTRYVRIGQARLRRDRRFVVKARPLAGVDLAVYRVSARLGAKLRSFTLPQTIARR